MPREAKFPARRPDGTAQVAASFGYVDERKVDTVRRLITLWKQGVSLRQDNIYADLFELPNVAVTPGTFLITFSIRADSNFWKDRIVELTQDIRRAVLDVRLVRFEDLVSGRLHRGIDLALD